jgi:hypothetical protein
MLRRQGSWNDNTQISWSTDSSRRSSAHRRSEQVESQVMVGRGGRGPLARDDVVAKKTSGRMEQLDLDSTSNLPDTPPPQFAHFTVIAKAVPGRKCSSCHSLTREELSLRGRIVFCVESCTRHCLSRPPSAAMAGGLSGGTGQKLTQATIIVAGVAALLASLLSVV